MLLLSLIEVVDLTGNLPEPSLLRLYRGVERTLVVHQLIALEASVEHRYVLRSVDRLERIPPLLKRLRDAEIIEHTRLRLRGNPDLRASTFSLSDPWRGIVSPESGESLHIKVWTTNPSEEQLDLPVILVDQLGEFVEEPLTRVVDPGPVARGATNEDVEGDVRSWLWPVCPTPRIPRERVRFEVVSKHLPRFLARGPSRLLGWRFRRNRHTKRRHPSPMQSQVLARVGPPEVRHDAILTAHRTGSNRGHRHRTIPSRERGASEGASLRVVTRASRSDHD